MGENVEEAKATGTQETGTPAITTPDAQTTTTTPKTFTEAEVEAMRKSAKNDGYREAQSHFSKKQVEEQQLQQQRQSARQRAIRTAAQSQRGLRVEDLDAIDQSAEVFELAEVGRNYLSQQQAQAQWSGYVTESATASGLDPNDPRIQGAVSAQDLTAKIASAKAADARAEAIADRERDKAKRQDALDVEVQSGALDRLETRPAGSTAGKDKELEAIADRLLTLYKSPTANKAEIDRLKKRRAELKG